MHTFVYYQSNITCLAVLNINLHTHTHNSRYHSMLLCQEEWGPIDTEKVSINHLRAGFQALILS